GVGAALETIFEVRRLSDLGDSGVTKTAPTYRVREVRPATPASSSPNNKQQLRNGRRVTKRRELRDMGAISFFERLPGIQFGRSGTFTNASTAITNASTLISLQKRGCQYSKSELGEPATKV